ncbi:MAG: prepilin-type N-terminal cleavage/methylation domain-containing protein [Candidatus Niyogibacteria bacterium]|nr:prepilin-type N-terminal cleavage/methylation domain-containing protein [Candidatus Niyogibacteria bacterium]
MAYPKSGKGFSLLETLVALAILNAAILGPISLAYVSIRSASLSHNITIAAFLAEEGVELARSQREKNIYSGNDWLNSLAGCAVGSPCRIATAADGEISVVSCGGSCAPLNYDSDIGLYWYESGNASIFTRSFTVEEIKENKEAKVTMTVSWKERFLSGNQNIQLESHLSNWH